jgi:uncharacterized protein (DUF433 family)
VAAITDIGALIVQTPGIVGGRPRLDSTRMAVATLAACWKQGSSADDIVNRVYPELSLAQVHAALAYYFANRDAVDRDLLEDELAGYEGEAEALRDGSGPPWFTPEQRTARIAELERAAALLRSRLG